MSGHAWHRELASAKKATVVEAAQDFFLERGYARASMAELAKRAGVSTTTLYKHFPSKDVLFEAVLDALAERFAQELSEAAGSAKDPLNMRLKAFALRYIRLLCEPDTVAMTRLIIAEAPVFEPIAHRFHQAMKGPVFARLAELIEGGVASGELMRHKTTDSLGAFLGHIERSFLLPALLDPTHEHGPGNDKRIAALVTDALFARYSRR